jgi:DNA-binding transcriptional ArsR family regulator
MRTFKVIRDPKGFEIIADKTRRRIIYLLRARELSVSQIADELEVTPQAIYHHIRKLLDGGMVEIAKEERIDHFIETYYRATAEVFEFTYGERTSQQYSEAEVRQAIAALAKLGYIIKVDEKTIPEYVELLGKAESLGAQPELEEKIAEMNDIGLLTSQHVRTMARELSMTDKQFDESLNLQREARSLLKSKLLGTPEGHAKQHKAVVR